MPEQLLAILDGAVAAQLTRLPDGGLRLEYDPAYRRRSDAVPLSVSMPLAVGVHADAVVRPWLAGLLPENDAVLRRWARAFHAPGVTAFALLGTPVGEDCPGAFRFIRPDRLDALLHDSGSVEWLTEADVATRLRDLRADATTWLGRDFTGRFSLAGAQAKTALLADGGRWGVPSGPRATTHILKPAIQGFEDHELNEHLCLDAARRAGLPAARSAIHVFDGESAVVVERYDRLVAQGQVVRIHQEDTCQALGVSPDGKYQSDGGPAPADLVTLFRRVMPSTTADREILRFADALAFNWLVAGTDAHAKNYSLLIVPGQIRLAPLYDLASGLPHAHERRLKLAMKLGGDYKLDLRRNPWPATAQELGLDAERVIERVRELAHAVPAAFADAARDPRILDLDRPLPAHLSDLVADRARRCLDVL